MPTRPIPTHLKNVVYYLGVDPDEVVSAREISPLGPTFDLHLRRGDLEWHGHVTAPAWPTVPRTRIEDLIDSTMDCPNCSGSGKVPIHEPE